MYCLRPESLCGVELSDRADSETPKEAPPCNFFDGGAIVSGVEVIVLAPGAAGEQP